MERRKYKGSYDKKRVASLWMKKWQGIMTKIK